MKVSVLSISAVLIITPFVAEASETDDPLSAPVAQAQEADDPSYTPDTQAPEADDPSYTPGTQAPEADDPFTPLAAEGSKADGPSLPEGEWYGSINAGPAWFDGPSDTGLTASGTVGYDLSGPFRAEVGLAYHRVNHGVILLGTSLETTIYAWTAGVNGFYDLELGGPFTPYAGAGIGLSRVGVKAEVIDPISGTVLSNEVSDTGFNFNLIAGVAYDFSEHTAFTAQFRYSDDAAVNAIEVGARFGF